MMTEVEPSGYETTCPSCRSKFDPFVSGVLEVGPTPDGGIYVKHVVCGHIEMTNDETTSRPIVKACHWTRPDVCGFFDIETCERHRTKGETP